MAELLCRWQDWLDYLQEVLANGPGYNATAWQARSLSITESWVASSREYPVMPSGSSIEVTRRLLAKYVVPEEQSQLPAVW